MNEITIHRLGPENADILMSVAEGVFDHAVQVAYLKPFLASVEHEMVVAVMDGQVVGMGSGVVYYHPDKPAQFWINEIGTGDAWLRQGIASKVMRRLFEIAKDRGCTYVWLGTEPDNVEALALYRALKGDEEQVVLFGWGDEGA